MLRMRTAPGIPRNTTDAGRDSWTGRPGTLDASVRGLSREIGVGLLLVGVAGLIIPGPVPPGALLVGAGLIVLWPRLLRGFGGWLRGRFPGLHRWLIAMIEGLRAGPESAG
jgi:hypothetical protein